MASLHDSQLSALAATISDAAEQVAAMAEDIQARESEAAIILYEVERSLQTATRSMDRARRALES